MILYFTGTGNSRYLAEAIAKALNDTVTDATKQIKAGEHPAFTSENPYVFVSPVYAWRMPRVFAQWLRKCTFAGNKKAYFVLSCGGDIGAASNYTEKLAAEMGFSYMGTAEVVMPENYLVMFTPTAKEEDDAIFEKARVQLTKLTERIAAEAAFDKVKITPLGRLCSGIVNVGFNNYSVGTKKFYATDACISCGKCAESCMLNTISLKDGKPVWGKDCTHCMACICKCPTEAIEYGRATKGRRRYVCTREP